METKSLSLREFNKKLIKKRANLNLEKIYQNDNYLIQTLKRTKRVTLEVPVETFESNLERILKKIYKEIKLLKDPLIEEIITENNKFKNDYNILLENFQNSTSKTFYELINLYKNKGYKIPSLNYKHNIFRINPLIEENTNKIMFYFLTQKSVKSKKEILLIKSLVFLNKLNRLISKINNKNKKKERRKSIDLLNQINEMDNNKENIESLKKYIKAIIDLINSISNLDSIDVSKNNQIKAESKIKIVNFNDKILRKSTIKDVTSRNKNNHLFLYSIINNKDNHRKSQRLNTYDAFPELDKSYILDNNTIKRGESDKKIKTIVNKNEIDIFNKVNMNLNSEKKEIHKILYKFNFENRNKNLNINPHNTKYSKTITNFYKSTKKGTESHPFFIRTQTNEKNYLLNNNNFDNKKRNLEEKSRNYTNSLPFVNKTEFFNFAYKRLKKGNFYDIDKYVKKYLNEIEFKTNEEIDLTLSKFDYKKFKNNLNDLDSYIRKVEVDKKIEKIYFHNFISKRIIQSLENMREKEAQINKFNMIASALGNTNK